MNLISLTSLLILSFLVLNQPDFSSAVCCKSDANFGCCGNGACNFFCCNCDDGCNPNCYFDIQRFILTGLTSGGFYGYTNALSSGYFRRGKRSTGTDAYNKFIAIDSDLDGGISFNETVQWLAHMATGRSKRLAATNEETREAIYLEFKKMDTNNNNLIEKNEFDHSLD
jgi:hypothetical protein